NAALIQSQTCNGSAFQQWKVVKDAAGYSELVNVGSGKCMDLTGGSTALGTNIQQWSCSGADYQKWNVSDQGSAQFAVLSKYSGLALDVYEFSTANGARIVQWDYLGGANQKWTLPEATYDSAGTTGGPTSGALITLKGVQAGQCIGVKDASSANGAQLQSQTCSGSTFQQWKAQRDASGDYELINVGSGRCIDLPGASTANSTALQQWGCSGGAWQKWTFRDDGAGHNYITSKSSGLAIDVTGRSTADGALIVQYPYQGGTNQQWIVGTSSGGSTGGSRPVVSGYAATSSSGLTTTTGGGSAAVETVTSCATLKSKLEDATARVLEIPSGTTLDCRTAATNTTACELKCSSSSSQVFWRVPVGDQTCTSLADFDGNGTLDVPAGKAVSKPTYDFRINVNSNKTVRGVGSGATLKGVSFNIANKSNIIVQNLAITEINPSLIEAGDALTINTSHHVWIDHCRFSMISDGYADIRYNSSAVTLSHNVINGANPYVCGGQHNFVTLVTDSQVTYHHNYFDHVGGRNPKVDGSADVHIYNNYYDSVSYFCANSGTGSEVLVENNHYYNSRYPHWAAGGAIEASGNTYSGSTSTAGRDATGSVFNPPYSYSLESSSSLNSSVPAQAGIGKY
ncbi:MAG TPA: RICIN domain-containing protein, partial [Polyangiaceae bacterium]|nr:RICIN domain-containing protein [Polyangiaceae bacterium]